MNWNTYEPKSRGNYEINQRVRQDERLQQQLEQEGLQYPGAGSSSFLDIRQMGTSLYVMVGFILYSMNRSGGR